MAEGREKHLENTLNLWNKTSDLKEKVANSKCLVVGAGGIGCELLKVKIEIVDLDTIDVSNLNRQFLFRRHHVGMSKALVAAEEVKKFNRSKDLEIIAHHGNIKDKSFGAEFMQKFDLVFNALDNIEARRHVNRICICVDKPLIDGGTQGYDGQVVTIKRGMYACYDCEPKPAPKGFPVCTIRSTPDKPIHCIVWAKHLFSLLFGVKDDQNSVTEGIDAATPFPDLAQKLFVDDIAKLAAMPELWKSRAPPTPLDIPSLALPPAAPRADRAALNDHTVWPPATTLAVLADRVDSLRARLSPAAPSIDFDKDDEDAMDFVTCAANLRARCFGIEEQTAFRCKDIAGNIIPAIATTNAIIAGVMALEAFKVIAGRLADCRTQYKHRQPTGRKSLILIPSDPDGPNPTCAVCAGSAAMVLSVDTARAPLRLLLDRVLRGELGLDQPVIDTGDNLVECLRAFDDPHDARRLQELLPIPLADPAVGMGQDAQLTVEDEVQAVKITLLIRHDPSLDPESDNPYVLDRRGASAAALAPAESAPAAPPADAAPAAPADDDDDLLVVEDGEPAAADGDAVGKKRDREEAAGASDGSADKRPREG